MNKKLTPAQKAKFQREEAIKKIQNQKVESPKKEISAKLNNISEINVEQDLAILKECVDKKAQLPIKRELLEAKYLSYLALALIFAESSKDEQTAENDVVAYGIIWLFDCGFIKEFVFFGLKAIELEYKTPNGFKSKLNEFIIGEFVDFILENPARILEFTDEISRVKGFAENENLPYQIKAKLEKMCGRLYEKMEKYESAIIFYQEALKIDEKSGVIGNIKDCEKALKNKSLTSEANPGTSPNSADLKNDSK